MLALGCFAGKHPAFQLDLSPGPTVHRWEHGKGRLLWSLGHLQFLSKTSTPKNQNARYFF
jgi:hypothetical protein